jgi:hypothetical protein
VHILANQHSECLLGRPSCLPASYPQRSNYWAGPLEILHTYTCESTQRASTRETPGLSRHNRNMRAEIDRAHEGIALAKRYSMTGALWSIFQISTVQTKLWTGSWKEILCTWAPVLPSLLVF